MSSNLTASSILARVPCVQRVTDASDSMAYPALSGCSAVGSASGLGPEGREFESLHPDVFALLAQLVRAFDC